MLKFANALRQKAINLNNFTRVVHTKKYGSVVVLFKINPEHVHCSLQFCITDAAYGYLSVFIHGDELALPDTQKNDLNSDLHRQTATEIDHQISLFQSLTGFQVTNALDKYFVIVRSTEKHNAVKKRFIPVPNISLHVPELMKRNNDELQA